MAHRSGFVNIIGNPNVGKSTLMNALVGEKLSIVTAKAQTTRHRIMGIVNSEDFQIVYSDTPGILKPNYRLQENMMRFVDGAISDADVILYVTDTVENADKNSEYVEKFRDLVCPVVVVINKIDDSKEGGDWETDIQEAINMICFTMRVHSNLVGSVPGKAQSNNSGSDKRELYTIAQALQKPYHDLLFTVHRIIIRFNGWQGVTVDVPFIQLTTLDEHQDAKQVKLPNNNNSTDNEDNNN